MPEVTFIKRDGTPLTIQADAGLSIMEIGRDNGADIEGTCGGSLSCATCHVIIDDAWVAKTGTPSADEEDMLDLAFGLEKNSRLGCQIKLTDDLNGLKLRIPADD